jgi:hypothetical protein
MGDRPSTARANYNFIQPTYSYLHFILLHHFHAEIDCTALLVIAYSILLIKRTNLKLPFTQKSSVLTKYY